MKKKGILIAVAALLLMAMQGVALADGKSGPAIGSQGQINAVEGEVGPLCFGEDFESGLGAWTLTDNSVPVGVDWVTTADTVNCNIPTGGTGPMANWTGGGGEAACISSDLYGQDYAIDTTMCAPMNLGAATDAQLTFLVNMWTFTNVDSLEITANGTTVATLLPNLGTFQDVPGSFESVDLSAYAGLSDVELCFTYVAGWDWYVQVDDIAVRGADTDVRCDAVPTDVALTGFGGDSGLNNWLPLVSVLLLVVVGVAAVTIRRRRIA